MAYKSSWSPAEIAEAEQLLKLHPPRVVAEKIGRTARQITNKFGSLKITKPGASLAGKSKYEKIRCMNYLNCGNEFLSWDRTKNKRCKACKMKEDGGANSHSLSMSASYGNVRGAE